MSVYVLKAREILAVLIAGLIWWISSSFWIGLLAWAVTHLLYDAIDLEDGLAVLRRRIDDLERQLIGDGR